MQKRMFLFPKKHLANIEHNSLQTKAETLKFDAL